MKNLDFDQSISTMFSHQYQMGFISASDIDIEINRLEHKDISVSQLQIQKISKYLESRLFNGMGIFFAPLVVSRRDDNILTMIDGIHRWEAIKYLKILLQNKKDASASYFAAWKTFCDTKIPLIVYRGLTPNEETQFYYEINHRAKKPNAAIKTFFDQSIAENKIANRLMSISSMLPFIETRERYAKFNNHMITIYTVSNKLIKPLLTIIKKQHGLTESTQQIEDEVFSTITLILQCVFMQLPKDWINEKVYSQYFWRNEYIWEHLGKFIVVLQENDPETVVDRFCKVYSSYSWLIDKALLEFPQFENINNVSNGNNMTNQRHYRKSENPFLPSLLEKTYELFGVELFF